MYTHYNQIQAIFKDGNLKKKQFGNLNLVIDVAQICKKKISDFLAFFVQVSNVSILEHTHDFRKLPGIVL